jgi:hypothetical protein
VLLVGAGAAAVVVLARRAAPREAAPARQLPGGAATVEISIRSTPPAEVAIDGRRAGRTPLTLELRRDTHPVVIEATLDGKPQLRSVVPDRDQVIRFQPGM